MHGLAIVLLASALLGLGACSTDDGLPEPGKLKTYSGIYMSAFEVSFFMPSSVAEHWWIRESPYFSEFRDIPVTHTAGFPDARYMHLRVKGRVSELGVWGHGGLQQRELVVSELLDISPATPEEFKQSECKLPLPEWVLEPDRKIAQEHCRRIDASHAGNSVSPVGNSRYRL